jgi:hypothetical protein
LLSVLGFEYPVAFRVWSSKHGIVGWIGDRSHEEARFVCRCLVLEAPFQVDITVDVMPRLPTLFPLCSMFIEGLYRCAEDLRKLLRYYVVFGFAVVREDCDSPGFRIVGSLCAEFDVVACIVLLKIIEQSPEVKSCVSHLVTGRKHVPRVAASHFYPTDMV